MSLTVTRINNTVILRYGLHPSIHLAKASALGMTAHCERGSKKCGLQENSYKNRIGIKWPHFLSPHDNSVMPSRLCRWLSGIESYRGIF